MLINPRPPFRALPRESSAALILDSQGDCLRRAAQGDRRFAGLLALLLDVLSSPAPRDTNRKAHPGNGSGSPSTATQPESHGRLRRSRTPAAEPAPAPDPPERPGEACGTFDAGAWRGLRFCAQSPQGERPARTRIPVLLQGHYLIPMATSSWLKKSCSSRAISRLFSSRATSRARVNF